MPESRSVPPAGTAFAALVLLLAVSASLSGCGRSPGVGGAAGEATAATRAANAQVARALRLDDPQDFADARRGFIARPGGTITGPDGGVLRDFDAYGFLDGQAPDTVNPSLWRHARLNAQIGLFKVTDGIYQLRGFDIANMTLVLGRTGFIVIDALTARESAAAALAFARRHLGERPVTALVYTHSHVDHFGGALGVLTARDAQQRGVPVVASAGFMQEASSENILMAGAMGRRSLYQFGRDLPTSARGNVDTGLGKQVVYGSIGILAPTRLVTRPTEEIVLDGVRFVFHNVPGAEAPAEMTFSIPEYKAYGGAENLAQTMHNLLPVRGAQVRDALRWAGYLQQALDELGEAQVYFGQHNWPVWGRERIAEFITKHRDVYLYTHDQSVRLANLGYTPREIADRIRLPASLASFLGARGYYGDLRHNAKAVYQRYLGAYDGNPANLDPLPPQESARRYLALIGGADKAVAAAQAAFDTGEYRWVAELLNHVVLGQGDHAAARQLLARTYDQLGYQSEAATWRNSYLTAAHELRNGPPERGVSKALAIDLLEQTPVERFLEAMAASLNGPDAEGQDLRIDLVLSDTGASYRLWIENAVLHFRAAPPAADANATLTLTRHLLVRMVAGTAGIQDTLLGKDLTITGSRVDLIRFFGLIDKPAGNFAIVTR